MRQLLAAFLLALAMPATTLADDGFDAVLARAKANEHSEHAYDEALARHFGASPGLVAAMNGCMVEADRGNLQGYFEFAEDGGYRLVLRPQTRFAACLERAFADRDPPAPPRRPYVHGFTYTVEATPPG